MAFCGNCGKQVADGVELCSECKSTGLVQTQPSDIKLMSVITYIGLLFIVPLVTGKYKDSPFLKFHLNQSLAFCIGYAIAGQFAIIPFIGLFLGGILGFGIVILQIISIVNAIKGETKSFPIISEIKIIK